MSRSAERTSIGERLRNTWPLAFLLGALAVTRHLFFDDTKK